MNVVDIVVKLYPQSLKKKLFKNCEFNKHAEVYSIISFDLKESFRCTKKRLS